MSKQQLIVTRGLPASGKSTWAKAWVKEDSKHRVRVNRDDIRRQLGPYWVPTREKLVTKIEKFMVSAALNAGYSVVVDATNFNHGWAEVITANPSVEMVIQDFTHVPLETCIERDHGRLEEVGEEVIMAMYEKYLKK